MRNGVLASMGGLTVVLALAWGLSDRINGQAPGTPATGAAGKYVAPRTAWGDPDLQGQWNSQTSTPLERPLTGALAGKETLTDEEAESLEVQHLADGDKPPAPGNPGTYNSFWFDRGKGLNRTSLLIDPPDGRVPAYTPEAEQRLTAERAERSTRGPADSYADLPPWTRCITRGWNGIGSNYSSNTQIFQSPGYVVVLQELIHEPRIIPLDGREGLPSGVRQWLGVSRGRWEGDTLVVETRNFNNRPRSFAGAGNAHDKVVVERFTRTAENRMEYVATIVDPKTFQDRIELSFPMTKVDGRIYEATCHEGNYSLRNSLSASRKEDAARK